MAANSSFDIVSEVDMQEVDNAVNQAKKEILTRYDFKASKSSVDLNRDEKKITLIGDDDFKLRSLRDILTTKMAKRGVSLKSLHFGEPEKAFEGTLRQVAEIATGIDKEKARDLVKIIKETGLKVQAAIEGEKIKVSGAKKDDLQSVIAHLRSVDFPLPLAFTNYR
jgi:cyclic-di-GMP-binding protein